MPDMRTGDYPPQAASKSKLISKEFTLASRSVLIARGHMVRKRKGRADLDLFVDGVARDHTLTWTPTETWEDATRPSFRGLRLQQNVVVARRSL